MSYANDYNSLICSRTVGSNNFNCEFFLLGECPISNYEDIPSSAPFDGQLEYQFYRFVGESATHVCQHRLNIIDSL